MSVRDNEARKTGKDYVIDSVSTRIGLPSQRHLYIKNNTSIYKFEVLQKLGIRVPESIAFVGFDDFELASTLRPSINVLQQPVPQIGCAAAELLFERILGSAEQSSKDARELKMLDTHLILRRSCEGVEAD